MFNISLQHRAKFQPNVFHRMSPDEEAAKKDPEHASRANTVVLEHANTAVPEPSLGELPGVRESRPKLTSWRMTVRRLSEAARYRSAARGNDPSINSRAFASERSSLRKSEIGHLQSVEEVWFAGCHTDVGGMYPTFHADRCLSL